jgi:hypothetical protein
MYRYRPSVNSGDRFCIKAHVGFTTGEGEKRLNDISIDAASMPMACACVAAAEGTDADDAELLGESLASTATSAAFV